MSSILLFRATPVRPSTFAALAMTTLAAVGCGGNVAAERIPVFPVKGSVTLRGQPMPGAFIVLHPKAPQAGAPIPRAEITKEGVLRVSTYDAGDGAPEGEYVVTVQWYKLVKQGSDTVIGPNIVPLKYAKPETSGIVIQVAAEPNSLQPIAL